jgi:acyl-CoA reductase-like NAD-dependent aldehyde dehydrogenase
MKRLDVRKTYKLYIGGQFARSESGKYLEARSPGGEHLDNFALASRKDLRDAVSAARAAQEAWAAKTPYLRGQILYRAAEMLQQRGGEMAREIARSTGVRRGKASAEVNLAVDRLVYWAGWSDKFTQVLGSVNPVASPHFNFSLPEPTGVVAVIAPDEPSLLPLVSLAAPAIVSGNSVVAVSSDRFPLPALTFAEILATSDLPGGVVNILAGRRAELAPHVAAHMEINAVVNGSGAAEVGRSLQGGTSVNLKRYASRSLAPKDWSTSRAEDPYWLLDALELKTAWHPIGI